MSNAEKLIMSISIKSSMKSVIYKVSVEIKDPNSKNKKENFETEEIPSELDGSEIKFARKMTCDFFFDKKQEMNITVEKKNLKTYIRQTILASLVISPNSIYERRIDENPKSNNTEKISITLEKKQTITTCDYSMFDYIKAGLKFSCYISCDLSYEANEKTQKFLRENNERIVRSIWDHLSIYTKEKKFYASGFGALDKKSNSNCFNLNLDKNDNGYQNREIIGFYNSILNNKSIERKKNVVFSSVIKKTTKDIMMNFDPKVYNILFIITYGIIDKKDIENTIDCIIESTYLPMTVIFIDIGRNNFSDMGKIFQNDYQFSTAGMKKMRENIVFSSLIQNFSNNEEMLMSYILNELSKQLLSFYKYIKSSPRHIKDNNIKNINDSCVQFKNSSIWIERDQKEQDQKEQDPKEQNPKEQNLKEQNPPKPKEIIDISINPFEEFDKIKLKDDYNDNQDKKEKIVLKNIKKNPFRDDNFDENELNIIVEDKSEYQVKDSVIKSNSEATPTPQGDNRINIEESMKIPLSMDNPYLQCKSKNNNIKQSGESEINTTNNSDSINNTISLFHNNYSRDIDNN